MTGKENIFHWYAIHVRSNYEKKTASALTRRGYESLFPSYRERRKWSDRTKILELPLFPGYVFSRFNVDVRLPILQTPGVLSVAGVGKTPQPVDEYEIEQILKVARLDHPAQPWPYLEVGQKVRIVAGPLTGVEGLLAQRRSETVVVLSVTLLQQAVSVQVERDAIRRI